MKKEQVFIPERYVMMLELLVEVPKHGRGILLYREDIGRFIKEGRIHANVITNRESVFVIEETALIKE